MTLILLIRGAMHNWAHFPSPSLAGLPPWAEVASYFSRVSKEQPLQNQTVCVREVLGAVYVHGTCFSDKITLGGSTDAFPEANHSDLITSAPSPAFPI